jgi:predicted Zn finger-like uncharacterized protein
MNLKCPKCQTVFQVDESDYAAILQQVKNAEFETEINRRLEEIQRRNAAEGKAHALQLEKDHERKLAEKDLELGKLKTEIERLRGVVQNSEATKNAELAKANQESVEKEAKMSAQKNEEIASLKSQIEILRKENDLNIVKERNNCQKEIHEKEKAITELTSKLDSQKVETVNKILEINKSHDEIIRSKDEEIAHYKDLKIRLSTKMLGETLEKHCQIMFDRARSNGQFQEAYFEKDNDISVGGTKGDFIFRDYLDGEEYISIMFEMKNEAEATSTKHHNEDFFAKLDKDRRDKQCEYAVLVSTLEADNDLYNEGIVDVSYLYDKMLVIRPQFFMSVIVMLSKTAKRGASQLIGLKHELEIAKAQSIDVTNFEKRRDKFAEEFGKLVQAHFDKQNEALDAINKAIQAAETQAEKLRKIKALFETSTQKLIKANEKVENDFTIRKLTYGNKTMQAKFAEAKEQKVSNEVLDGE